MDKKNELMEAVSAIALEPGKFYILNLKGTSQYPRNQVIEMVNRVQKYLATHGIHAIFVPEPTVIDTITEITKADFNKKAGELKNE